MTEHSASSCAAGGRLAFESNLCCGETPRRPQPLRPVRMSSTSFERPHHRSGEFSREIADSSLKLKDAERPNEHEWVS